ncbi:MAG: hypothetical protein GX660_07990 [Clostridiaceae bacterium]|nr:hypothetical protein [Clostridiaceae bacterium]
MSPYYSYPFITPDADYSNNPCMQQYQNPYFMTSIQNPAIEYPYAIEGMEEQVSYNPGYQYYRQNPILSDNPAQASIVLQKELTGFPSYGNPSGNADILYTGNRGAWNFNVPAFLFVPGNLRAQIVISAVLDDHYDTPVNRYSARITINGTVVHNGRVPLVHGRPAGGMFNNWRSLTFNVPNFRRNNRVVIENTSTAGSNDWIAFDWMELRILTR